jgi:hypothetical protein
MTFEEWKTLQAEKAQESLTCPRCGHTSDTPHDVRYGYCVDCRIFLREVSRHHICAMKPGDARRAKSLGYVYIRTLADGRFLGVEADLQGGAFLKLCSGDDPHSLDGVDDLWQYQEIVFALHAAATWDPAKQSEPFGFYRHPFSGRRRPFGNPLLESIHA